MSRQCFNLLTSTHDQIAHDTAIQNGVMVNVDADLFSPSSTLYFYVGRIRALQSFRPTKKSVEVLLACQLTEVGTLKMECGVRKMTLSVGCLS
ncbi:hypothetical protein O9993_08595 [Vibrio lentus]|nr:hypothetical protein [Vibrio lentus]